MGLKRQSVCRTVPVSQDLVGRATLTFSKRSVVRKLGVKEKSYLYGRFLFSVTADRLLSSS